MSEKSVAVDTLDRLAVMLTGVQEAAKQLRELDSYESARDQLIRDHKAATEQLTATSILHNQAKQDLTIAQTDAETARRQATVDAKSIRDSARADAEKMLDEAKAKVSAELDRQSEARKDDKAKLDADILKAIKELDGIQRKTVIALQAEKDANAKADIAQANLDKIRAAAREMAQ